jgi:hypothetical protein
MSHVFISYSRTDRDRAKRFAAALQERGHAVWWDDDIAAGQTFDAAIEKALGEAACVVVLWSSTSVKSDWVKTEAAEATRRRILVPVLVDEVAIPLEFRRLQTANLARWSGRADDAEFDKVLRAIDIATKGSSPQPASGGNRGDSRSDTTATGGAADARSAGRTASEPVGESGRKNDVDAVLPQPAARTGRRAIALSIASMALILAISGSVLWVKSRPQTAVARDVEIPNVVGMSYDNAAAALAALRLIPERQERTSASAQAGTILAQTPTAGTTLAPMTKVVLAVAAPVAVTPAPGPPPNGDTNRRRESNHDANTPKSTPPPDPRVNTTAPPQVVETPKPEALTADAPKIDREAEDELQNRLQLAKTRGQALADFFDRRRRTVETSGGHLRPEIETAVQEYALGVRSATKSLQDHQVAEARNQIETLEKTLQRLDAMK